jgi:ABC-type phosphate transport system substrate-binding protein
MGIYNQARRVALGVACSASVVASVCMAAAPGSALAAVTCANVTGSGSTLQSTQQENWIKEVSLGAISKGGATECSAAPTIGYNLPTGTGSGQGLLEFGMPGGVLVPAESSNKSTLDAYVGTDDPPSEASWLEGEKAAGTKPWAAAMVAAPVAIIVHPPSGCKIKGEVSVTNANLSKVFAGEAITWEEFLGVGNVEGTCTGQPMRDVRSDSSGTSFALKQYLCQENPALWGKVTLAEECETGKEFVTDAATWPKEAEAGKEALLKHPNKETPPKEVENQGSGGMVEAVENEVGSVGYVNLANAAAGGKFVLSTASAPLFWVNVEGIDPLKVTGTKNEGNCPTTKTLTTAEKTEAEAGTWVKIHLAKVGLGGTTYPLCTLTYDIGWASYTTTTLEKEYATKGAAVGATAKLYFKYMASQAAIAEYYAKVPSTIQTISEGIAASHIG